MKIVVGLDSLIEEKPKWLRRKRIGLLANQASVSFRRFLPAHLVLKELLGSSLVRLFSPQHGLYSTKQANMVPSEDEIDPLTGIPVISLYGPRLSPEPSHLQDLDLLLVDLQDVGCRVYTYMWTLLLVLKQAATCGLEVAVLDRPNPLGDLVEGPILSPHYRSFVGLLEIPMCHGLTLGELALLFKMRLDLEVDLKVVKVKGWKRRDRYPATGLPWCMPSPNMPNFSTALVYPGQVLLEGTNLSEGRGTTRPFEVFGAPWLRIERLLKPLEKLSILGVKFRPVIFEPTFDKWKGEVCQGFQLHVVDESRFRPVKTTLLLLRRVAETHEEFEFRPPPYEFEENIEPIKILLGRDELIDFILGKCEEDVLDFWMKDGLTDYGTEVERIKIYE